ncbi:MAG: alpha/beta hydrolase [Alphaproteobacteria bacterium]
MRPVARILLSIILTATAAPASAESVVEIESRGQRIRALLEAPANPVGSVILLVGGHGKLDIEPSGAIGWGGGNQLARTRSSYAAAGFATLLPDIAPDLKTPGGVVAGYRLGQPHGRDLGALVQYMRGVKTPVVVVATSRGAPSAGAMLRHSSGGGRPDALVMTAGMLMPAGNQPNFRNAIGGDAAPARLPLLLVGHKRDECAYTRPASIDEFRAWHGGAVDVIMLDGGSPGRGDPCQAQSAHGFLGLDREVVDAVTGWIRRTLR